MYFALQVLLFILITSLVSIVVYLAFKKRYKSKIHKLKNNLNILLALNISHLHDASNFFSLIKRDLESGQDDREIKDTKNFAKGAAFHFRSIFDELKSGKELLRNSNLESSLEEKLELFYKKSKINLKDLMELELFQISDIKRLQCLDLRDHSDNPAWVYGNFSLLSKVLINLVENALKYCPGPIKIELNESLNSYELKITSYGASLKESIVRELGNTKLANSLGHGLESLKDIIAFHEGEIHVSSFEDEGLSISLDFMKIQKNKSINVKQLTPELRPRFIKQYLLVMLLFVLISSFAMTRVLSQINAKQQYIFLKESISSVSPQNQKRTQLAIKKLDTLWQEVDLSKYKIAEKKFINSCTVDNEFLIRRLLLLYKAKHQTIYNRDLLLEETLELQRKSFFDSSLNYRIAYIYSQKNITIKSIFYSALGLVSFFKELLIVDFEKYVIKSLEEENKVMKFLASRVNSNYFLKNAKVKPKIKKEPQELIIDDPVSRQDKALGIEFKF